MENITQHRARGRSHRHSGLSGADDRAANRSSSGSGMPPVSARRHLCDGHHRQDGGKEGDPTAVGSPLRGHAPARHVEGQHHPERPCRAGAFRASAFVSCTGTILGTFRPGFLCCVQVSEARSLWAPQATPDAERGGWQEPRTGLELALGFASSPVKGSFCVKKHLGLSFATFPYPSR